MAVTPVNSVLTVVTAGTRVRCSANTTLYPNSVYFECISGTIYVGVSTVSSSVYIAKLTAGNGITISSSGVGVHYRSVSQGVKLSDLYIDAAGNGATCAITYMNEQG